MIFIIPFLLVYISWKLGGNVTKLKTCIQTKTWSMDFANYSRTWKGILYTLWHILFLLKVTVKEFAMTKECPANTIKFDPEDTMVLGVT